MSEVASPKKDITLYINDSTPNVMWRSQSGPPG